MQTSLTPPAIPSGLLYENPSLKSFSRIGLILLLILVAGNTLLWGTSPGVGTGLFVFILTLIYWQTHPDIIQRRGALCALILLFASSIEYAIAPRWEGFFTTVLLILFLSGNMSDSAGVATLSSLKRGISNLIFSPMRWAWLSNHFRRLFPDTRLSARGIPLLFQYTFQIVLPALLVCAVFAILLVSANVIMDSLMTRIMNNLAAWLELIEFPSLARIFFSITLLTLCLGLIWPKALKRKDTQNHKEEAQTNGSTVSRMASLRYFLILLGVNALYFMANTIDGLYLWLHQAVPVGINHSQFVHQGTNNLIVTVILAALLITFLTSQKRISSCPWIKKLSLLWIAQNLFLVMGVGLRVYLYIESYQWTLLRFYLIVFLTIVFLGFLWLSARVLFRKNFFWLIEKNALTVFTLIYLLQFFNTRGFIADNNVQDYLNDKSAGLERSVDIHYLAGLGHPAFPALITLGEKSLTLREEISNLLQKSIKGKDDMNWQSQNWLENRHINAVQSFLKTSSLSE